MALLFAALSSNSFLVPSPAPRAVTPRAAVSMMAAGNDAVSFGELDGKEVRVGILRARWHGDIIDSLVDGAIGALKECGVDEDNIVMNEVPGSFELPLATRYLALSGQCDVILPIGVLIKGDTLHFEVIAESVTKGLMDVGLSTGVPVIFGVLTVNTEEQAKDRSTGTNNHGTQWGKAAVEMALLRSSVLGRKGRKFFLGFGSDGDSSSSEPQKVGEKRVGF